MVVDPPTHFPSYPEVVFDQKFARSADESGRGEQQMKILLRLKRL